SPPTSSTSYPVLQNVSTISNSDTLVDGSTRSPVVVSRPSESPGASVPPSGRPGLSNVPPPLRDCPEGTFTSPDTCSVAPPPACWLPVLMKKAPPEKLSVPLVTEASPLFSKTTPTAETPLPPDFSKVVDARLTMRPCSVPLP